MGNNWTVLIATFLAAAFFVDYVSSTSVSESQGLDAVKDTARSKFVLPALFNFEQYQQLFNKHYSSITEKLIRARLYLGRACRVFISNIAYKNRQSSMYLQVNQMSDWTQSEFEEILINEDEMRRIQGDMRQSKPSAGETNQQNEQIAPTDLDEVRDVLEEAMKSKEKNPAFAEIAEELQSASNNDGNPHDKQSIQSNAVGGGEQDSPGVSKWSGYLNSLVSVFSLYKHTPGDLPDVMYVDHTQCLLPVEDQGHCGSCYAFALMTTYEWAYCKAKNRLVYFSKQYVVDCGTEDIHLFGCESGSHIHVDYFNQKFGLFHDKEYPYKAKKSKCPYEKSTVADESKGTVRIDYDKSKVIGLADIDANLENGPIAMMFRIDKDCSTIMEYGGGVDTSVDCGLKGTSYHAMTIVGSGREDDIEYYLVRNSWSFLWGQEGYYKVDKKHSILMEDQGVLIKFATVPVVTESRALD